MTPFVFVSHASADKARVRPLVEALALQGLNLWLDRPGHGSSHFNFDDDFIERFGIRSLPSGERWSEEIAHALREAGAVLLCISKSLFEASHVWLQELTVAAHDHKLVTCVIDGTRPSRLPRLGLIDLAALQTASIDTDVLQGAVTQVSSGTPPASLPSTLRAQWQITTGLVSDIEIILDRSGARAPSPRQLQTICSGLVQVPIGPVVHAAQIPLEVIRIFADRFSDSRTSRHFVQLAMKIRSACNPEAFTEEQIVVSAAEVRDPAETTAAAYWADVLTVAGSKSRRTLAALLMTPGAPSTRELPQETLGIFGRFGKWLREDGQDD